MSESIKISYTVHVVWIKIHECIDVALQFRVIFFELPESYVKAMIPMSWRYIDAVYLNVPTFSWRHDDILAKGVML